MTALIVVLSVLGYAAGYMISARMMYQASRPYREPVNCAHLLGHSHYKGCYRREGAERSEGSAFGGAAALALVWPLILLGTGLYLGVTAGHKPLPGESEARIRRLEHDCDLPRTGMDELLVGYPADHENWMMRR